MNKTRSLLFLLVVLFLAGCTPLTQPVVRDDANSLPVVEENTEPSATDTEKTIACEAYMINEYQTPLLGYLNGISSSTKGIVGQSFEGANSLSLSGFAFQDVQTPYFSVRVPTSGRLSAYSLFRNDLNEGMRILQGNALGDVWTILSFEVLSEPFDITNYSSPHDLVTPSVINTNAQDRKAYIVYGPDLCGDDLPCEGGSTAEYFIVSPLANNQTLLITIPHSSDILVQYLLHTIFASVDLL